MAVSSVSCVYWEWQRDDGGFSPYVPEISNAIEAANHAGLGAHNSGSYTVDFARMIQRKNATGFERQVQRRQLVLPSTPDITAYWTWNEHGTNFVLYDIQSSVDIELAYLNQDRSIDLSKCPSKLPYTLDFHRMEQTRHGYNTRRHIRRCPLPYGSSLQSLLGLAPGLTGLAGSAGMMTGIGARGGGYAFPGYGSGPVPTPAPVMMNPAATHVLPPVLPPSGMMNFGAPVPSAGGHVTKSGGIVPFSMPGPTPPLPISGMPSHVMMNSMTTGPAPSFAPGIHVGKSLGGLTTSTLSSRGSSTGRKSAGTRTITLGGTPLAQSLTNHTPPTSAVNSSSWTPILPPSSNNASLSSTTSTSPQKRRRKHKTASNSTGDSSGAASSTGAAVGTEKSKARKRRKDKKSRGGGVSSSKGYNDETSKYARKKKRLKKDEDGPCPICMNQLSEDSGFADDDETSSSTSSLNVCKLRKCGHMLHHPCLIMYIKNSSNGGFQCPTCKKSYGVKTGDMPDGQMSVRNLPSTQLPGHEGHGAIEITYNFRPGVYNGRRYSASAFPRVCFLPDTPKGRKVLKLLRVAWDRRLTFTIGTSVTSGQSNTVVWNEIHHKTTINNYSGHGYPDPGYLDRVMLELAAQGVTEDSGESDNERGSSTSSSENEDEERVVAVGGAKQGASKASAIVLGGMLLRKSTSIKLRWLSICILFPAFITLWLLLCCV